jgi:broad specificity phosphatase PhoE
MIFVYLSHPEVNIDPGMPVTEWSLSAIGRARMEAFAARWPFGAADIVSSPERKAREAAAILARATGGATPRVDPRSGEIDRSATGYVPKDRHDALSAAFFARPDRPADGWETADAVAMRMEDGLMHLLAALPPGQVRCRVMVGHGAAGTLLYARCAGLPITQALDQPGQGCVWTARIDGTTLHDPVPWRPFEAVV